MKYKNIFLTGSTGILGKPLLKKLVNEGHSVFALSRNKLNDDFLISNNAKIINGDLLCLKFGVPQIYIFILLRYSRRIIATMVTKDLLRSE